MKFKKTYTGPETYKKYNAFLQGLYAFEDMVNIINRCSTKSTRIDLQHHILREENIIKMPIDIEIQSIVFVWIKNYLDDFINQIILLKEKNILLPEIVEKIENKLLVELNVYNIYKTIKIISTKKVCNHIKNLLIKNESMYNTEKWLNGIKDSCTSAEFKEMETIAYDNAKQKINIYSDNDSQTFFILFKHLMSQEEKNICAMNFIKSRVSVIHTANKANIPFSNLVHAFITLSSDRKFIIDEDMSDKFVAYDIAKTLTQNG